MWPWVVAAAVLLPLATLAVLRSSPGTFAAASAPTAPPATTTVKSTSDTHLAVDTIFLNSVRAQLVPFDTEAHVIRLAHQQCEQFAGGASLAAVTASTVSFSVTSGIAAVPWSQDQATFVARTAVAVYCPEQSPHLQN
jgi:hypothetical protein